MGLLTKKEVATYALYHGRIFQYVCDEDGCGQLILPGACLVVRKWKKRTDGLTFLGAEPLKVRCMGCELAIHPPIIKAEVSVKGAGRGAKKVSPELASKLIVNPIVRRAVINIIKKDDGKLIAKEVVFRLRKRKAIREIKKGEVSATLRAMRKLKLVKVRAKLWTIPVAKIPRKKRTVAK